MKQFFKFLGWIVGILSFLIIRQFLFYSIESLGITTYIDYGETTCFTTRFYDVCEDGAGTDIAFFFAGLAAVLSIGLGNIIHDRKFPPFSSSKKSRLTYNTWLVSLLVLSMIGLFVLLVLGPDIGIWVNVILTIIVATYGYKYIQQGSNENEE